MLDQGTRAAILQLHERGHGIRTIARAMKVSRDAVRDVIARGSDEVPIFVRPELAEPYREQILELYDECKRNLVRVHEKLLERGVQLSYQALTAFCRRHEIGHAPKQPSGRCEFEPGQEMQHDTSPTPRTSSHAARSANSAPHPFRRAGGRPPLRDAAAYLQNFGDRPPRSPALQTIAIPRFIASASRCRGRRSPCEAWIRPARPDRWSRDRQWAGRSRSSHPPGAALPCP